MRIVVAAKQSYLAKSEAEPWKVVCSLTEHEEENNKVNKISKVTESQSN